MKKDKIKQYGFILQQLVGRELKKKYSRSILGIVWSVLQPMLMMIVMMFIFSYMFSRSIELYPLYYLAGTLTWGLFAHATSASVSSIVDNRGLISKVIVPKQIFPMARVCSETVNFLFSLIAYAIMMVVYRVPLTWRILLLPIIILCIFFFTLGISYILSTMYVFFGDIRHLYAVLLNMLMFMSAIFYSADALSPQTQIIVENNPMYNYITCVRNCAIYGITPTAAEWLRCLLWAVGSYIVGVRVFARWSGNTMRRIN